MPTAKAKSKAPVLTPEQEALRRATEAYQSGAADYSRSLAASGSIKDAIARAAAEADPSLEQLRTSKADLDKRLGTVFADSLAELEGITDPRIREAIRSRRSAEFGSEGERLGGLISDRRGAREQQVERFANIFGAQTQTKQFDVEQRRTALERAIQAENTRQERTFQTENTRQQRAFESRFDELTRREKEAAIGASNRSNRGGAGGINSISELIGLQNNPLVAMRLAGYTRAPAPNGGLGYFFYDKAGNPVDVDTIASAIGASKGALLEGSTNPADQALIQQTSGKPLSAEAARLKSSIETGLQSTRTLTDIIKKPGWTAFTTGRAGLIRTPLIGGILGSGSTTAQQFALESWNVMDALSRLRTGAALTKNEEKFYSMFIPGATDTQQTRNNKIGLLNRIFSAAKLNPVEAQTLINTQVADGASDLSSFEQP